MTPTYWRERVRKIPLPKLKRILLILIIVVLKALELMFILFVQLLNYSEREYIFMYRSLLRCFRHSKFEDIKIHFELCIRTWYPILPIAIAQFSNNAKIVSKLHAHAVRKDERDEASVLSVRFFMQLCLSSHCWNWAFHQPQPASIRQEMFESLSRIANQQNPFFLYLDGHVINTHCPSTHYRWADSYEAPMYLNSMPRLVEFWK